MLLASYFFPPRYAIGGKRAYRFARYLPRHGWIARVVTAQAPARERVDPTFADDRIAGSEVVRDYLDAEQLRRLDGRELGSDGTVDKPTARWPSPVDARTGWARVRAELRWRPPVGPDFAALPKTARRLAAHARSFGAEAIVATGGPWECVAAGALAGEIASLPVVVDFRDPWSFGPLASQWSAWSRAVDAFAERQILRRAAALTVTSESTRAAYEELGVARRVVCIRNAFDPEVHPSPARHPAPTLVHFGNCYAGRTLEPIVRALAAVIERRKLRSGGVRILNLGRPAESDVALAASLGIGWAFESTPVVPYEEGIDLVAGADLALLLGFGESGWQLPGKLYDYLLARAPILGVGKHPELADLLDRTGLGVLHVPDDIDAMARHIERALDARAGGPPVAAPKDDVIASFSAINTASQLADLLAQVTQS